MGTKKRTNHNNNMPYVIISTTVLRDANADDVNSLLVLLESGKSMNKRLIENIFSYNWRYLGILRDYEQKSYMDDVAWSKVVKVLDSQI